MTRDFSAAEAVSRPDMLKIRVQLDSLIDEKEGRSYKSIEKRQKTKVV